MRKHADAKVLSGTLSAEIGSWNRRAGKIDLTVPLNADASVRARFVANASEQDAFIDLEQKRSTLLYGVVDADLTPTTRLSIGASDQRDKRSGVLWAGLPYWYADGTRTDWDRSKTTATKWNQWDTIEQTAFATLEHVLSGRWKLRGDLGYHRQREDSKLLWMWGDPDRSTGLGMSATPYHYIADPEQTHLSVSLTGPFKWLGREHELHVGAMHSRLRDGWQNRDLIDNADGADDGVLALPDFNHWDGSFPEPPMTDHYVASRGTTTQSALYGVARLQLTDRLKAIAGARVSQWKRDEEAAIWDAGGLTIKHSNVVTPYAGLVYDRSAAGTGVRGRCQGRVLRRPAERVGGGVPHRATELRGVGWRPVRARHQRAGHARHAGGQGAGLRVRCRRTAAAGLGDRARLDPLLGQGCRRQGSRGRPLAQAAEAVHKAHAASGLASTGRATARSPRPTPSPAKWRRSGSRPTRCST